ncbi:LamG-like jellyroll fold domain-containing protein [Micromonospora sp. NPDC049559]|uniref:LamG-like jellyroll fold domain-containing protein n=1 Tax=Micromonospora sp. NPDC049559 TaxID=3155923 RepID=UPI003442738A
MGAPKRRGGHRTRRRIAVVTGVLFMLTVAVPAGVAPAGRDFPMSWLWSWLRPATGWALPAVLGLPAQPSGTAAGKGHYVPGDATRARGGAGRAPGRGIGAVEPYAPPSAEARRSTTPARAGDHSFDPRSSRRMGAAATANSDVYANSDGSYTRKVYERAVNYRATDGTWRPIDRTLVPGGDGRLRQRAAGTDLSFAGRAADPALASLRLDVDHAFAYGLRGAAAVAPEPSGESLTYRGVLPGVDVRLSATASGVKESLVLHSADAGNSWVFPLRLKGLTPRLEAGGSVSLRDTAGAVRLTIPPGYMEDSRFDRQSGDFTRSNGVSYQLVTSDGGPALRVTVDEAWLRDPARVFPVTVDPTANLIGSTDTYARNDQSGDHSGEDELLVGTYNGGASKAYSFIGFGGFDATYGGSSITSVSLKIFDSWAATCEPKPFSVNPITQSWTSAAVTSYPGPSFGPAIGSVTANPGAACTNSGGDRSLGTWMTVPLSVETFQNWANGGANYGLAVTASQTDSTHWKRFTSLNGPAGKDPYLQVTYTNQAPQVDAQYPPSGRAVTTLTPELLVAAHDPDSPHALTYQFLVYDGDGTVVADSGWISSRSWSVPAGKLKWAESYRWTVGAKDGSLVSTSQRLNDFTTPVPQPFITSALAQNGGAGYEPNVGNYTTSATDATVQTVGPALSVERSYNSLDPRSGLAFGTGWSSLFDAKATEQRDAAGGLQTVAVTYPGGQEVAFGRNTDGSFTPPSGRFASFTAVTGGYRLIDKDGTTYAFTTATGTAGQFGLTSLADAQGRTETLTFTSGRVTKVTSASGRSLYLTWDTPAGALAPHVATVYTDPVRPGDASTVLTWRYSYDGDLLTKVCPPTSTTACTSYTYGTATRYPVAVQNAGPRSYWRLAEGAGVAAAASAVLASQGTDSGGYTDVNLGQAGPLPGSTATAGGFNGTSSRVQLPSKLVTSASNQSISLWFRTTTPGGVLFSYQADPVTNPTTPGNYTPSLYIGSSGKLYGQFWATGGAAPIATAAPVTDGAWHHVVLSAAGSGQSLYLDGALVGTKSGAVKMIDAASAANSYLGGGFIGGNWPDQPHQQPTDNTGYATYFAGTIGEVGFFDRPLTAADVTNIHSAGKAAARPLTSVVRPSGNASAVVDYDPVTGAVRQVTDANGGVWKLGPPVVSGSSQVYAGAVLSGGPSDYWRLAETGTVDAINEVNGAVATYSTVTLGASGGPFEDATVASLDGTSSYLSLPAADVPTTSPASVSMWFNMPSGSTAGGVLYSYQTGAIEDPAASTYWTPALYVGTDGKLRGQVWTGSKAPVTSTGAVNDGKWHHVVLAAAAGTQTLYLDGKAVGTLAKPLVGTDARRAFVGAGKWSSWPGVSANPVGYFPGKIADVAYFRSQLSAAQVSAQFAAANKTSGIPVKIVTITDPGDHTIQHVYELSTGHEVAETDALGNKTQYGYDVAGFLRTVTDPNGNVTTSEHDVRGNVVSQTTCQDRSANRCSTVYMTYYPDATSEVLTPDPRNDVLLTERDGRSASATDNTYLTSYAYDAKGNRTTATDALGRVTTTAYTDGTTVAALDGGYAPAGLPMTVTTPGGAKQSVVYYRSGDVAKVTDPAGKVTTFTYDGLGRVLTETEASDSDPAGLTTSYRYDGLGRVTTQTEPPVTNRVSGAVHTPVTTTVYDADGLVTSQTVADTTGGDAPRTESSTYNARGQQETSTDSAGKTTRLQYDGYGNVVRETEPDGGVTTSTYDAEGNLLTSTVVGFTGDPNQPGPARDVVVTSKAYDPAGRLASETDAMGWVTAYTYTDNGLTAKVTRRDPTTGESFVVEENAYDAAGNLVSTVSNNGATTTTAVVDAAGRVKSSTLDPATLKRTTAYEYSRDDHLVASTLTDPAGLVARQETLYDPVGRPLAETTHNGAMAPMGRWRLNETTGTRAADSAGNSPATATNVTWSTARGGAASFNATSSVIETAGPVLDTARGFTVSAWAYLTDASRNRTVIAQEGDSESGFYVKFDHNAGDRWSLVLPDRDDPSTSTVQVRSATAAAVNTWTHLTGVYDPAAGQIRLYVNGQLSATTAVPATRVPWTARGPLTMGRVRYHGTLTDYWSGSISDAQAYSRALTASEISGVYAGTAPAKDAGVVRTSYQRDADGLVTAETDSNGNVTDYEYDEDGERVATISPPVLAESGGGTPVSTRPITYAGYNTFGEQVETKDAAGNVTVTAYDAAGRVDEVRQPAYTPPGSTTPIRPVTSYDYDDQGQLTATTDPLNRTTRYVYDQLGRVAKTIAPNLGETRYTYDLLGDVLSETDPVGAVTAATYDYLGRKTTTTEAVRQDAASYTTTYTYGFGGWLAQERSPAGVLTKSTYNAAGEQATDTDGANNVTSYTYDGAGRLVRTTMPDGTYTTVTYDMAGRSTATRAYSAAGVLLTTESTEYDPEGNVLASTDARGTRVTFAYDVTGMVVSERQPVSGTDAITTTFGYDVNGNRTRFTDGRGSSFITTYNSWDLPESEIEPATSRYPNPADRTFTTVYDAAGQARSELQPGGVVVTNTYDEMGNLKRQTGTGAEVATPDRVFGYDLAERLTSVSAPGGTNTFSYDDRDLLRSTTGPSGNSSFTYNPDGEMTARTDAAGTTGYGYDTAGRVKTVVNTAAGVQVAYGYNRMDQVDSVTYGNNGNRRSISYDDLHRLTGDELKTPGGATIAKITYGYDENGNEKSKTTTGFAGSTTNTYTYDLADRLTSASDGTTTTAYEYDKAGNRTRIGNTVFTYDQRNQLLSAGGDSYQYTARGTLASETSGSLTYATRADAFGQVRSQQAPAGTETYDYDALGRLIRPGFTYSGTGNTLAADGTATYTRDADDDLLGVASGSNLTLAWTDLHTDVVGQFTAAGTALTGSTTYDPLGRVVATAGMLGHLGYQSEWTDFVTGRVNMWARWYNTDTAQFDTRDTADEDPIPDSVNANRFAYADDNPLTVTDPTGHWGIGSLWKKVKKKASSVKKKVGKAVRAAKKKVSKAYHAVKKKVSKAVRAVKKKVSKAYKKAKRFVKHTYKKAKRFVKKTYHKAKRWVKKTYHKAKKYVAHKVHQVKRAAQAVYHKAKQAGSKIVAKTVRVVKQAANTVKDAYNATEKWVKDNKNAIIEAVAIGGAILAGIACTAATAGAGAVACMVGAAAVINLAKDAAQGDIHNWGDAFASAGVGAAQGALGAAGGAIGGKVAGALAGRMGGIAGSLGGRVLTGATAGGVGDALTQLAMTGRVDLRGVLTSAAIGGAVGGFYRGRAASGCKHSFDPNTKVLLADGSKRPIKDVKVGDRVATTDPETGRSAPKVVTDLHLNRDTELTDVTVARVARIAGARAGAAGTVAGPVAVAALAGTEVLRTTAHHPFFDETIDRWVDAGELTPGHELRTADGERVLVAAVRNHLGGRDMRDLTVADVHTYYVLAGETAVLVHNCPPGDGPDGVNWDDIDQQLGRVRPTDGTARAGDPLEQPKTWGIKPPDTEYGRGITLRDDPGPPEYPGQRRPPRNGTDATEKYNVMSEVWEKIVNMLTGHSGG